MDDSGFPFPTRYAGNEHEAICVAQAAKPGSSELVQGPEVPEELVQVAKRIKAVRDSRAAFLDSSLFGEPAWNMLLALFVAAGERYALSISALCAESGAPASTAARAINRLLGLKMVRRVPNPSDNRSAYIELSADTVGKLSELLDNARTKYLSE